MEKIIKHTLILSLTIVLFGCLSSNNKHIGEWIGTDKSEIGSLILNEGNSAVFVLDNQVLGGDGFEMNGIKSYLKYEIDYSKEPIWLDLVLYEEGQKEEKVRLKGIIRFITENKMQYRANFDPSADRFIIFDYEDKVNTVMLNKVTK